MVRLDLRKIVLKMWSAFEGKNFLLDPWIQREQILAYKNKPHEKERNYFMSCDFSVFKILFSYAHA